MKNECSHRHTKEIHTHGYRSKGYLKCLDCGNPISRVELKRRNKYDRKRTYKNNTK
jgi:hypothetical protein